MALRPHCSALPARHSSSDPNALRVVAASGTGPSWATADRAVRRRGTNTHESMRGMASADKASKRRKQA